VFFGCVGKDNCSKILQTLVRADGVNVLYQKKASMKQANVRWS
jgi:hypothetical protein